MDDNFIKNFKSNFRVLLSKCDKCTNSDETYEVKQNVPILDDSGWLETSVVQRFDYSRFFDSHRHEIRQMRCYNSLLDLFSKNPFIQRFYDEFGGDGNQTADYDVAPDIKESIERDFVFEFLKCYLSESTAFEFDESLFERIMGNLINFVENESHVAYVFFPLHGLSGDFDDIRFSDDVSVSRLDSNQYAMVTDMDTDHGYVRKPKKRLRKLRYGVFIRRTLENGRAVSSERMKEKAQRVLDSFRLFKSGRIYTGAMYSYSPDSWPRKNLFTSRVGVENPPEMESEMFVSGTEIDRIKCFFTRFTRLEHIGQQHYLTTSIRRFNTSYNNKHIGDKIADLCISLETLLNDSPGEITLKLSLRVALLLGDTEDNREYLWRFIKKCYNVRSEIVHGKKRGRITVMGKIMTEHQTAQKLENVTRQAITKVVLLQGEISGQKNLLDSLDCSIVNRKKLLESEKL